jgi:hypothetical protein
VPLIRGFMIILYMGVPFIVVGMVGMASMRATGDTRLPSMLMILAAVLNVILDPILIFGVGPVPAMGLNGAAMAALLARATIFVGTLYLMRHRMDMVSFSKPDPGRRHQHHRAGRGRRGYRHDRALRARRRRRLRCCEPDRVDDAGHVLRAVGYHRAVRRAEFFRG